MAKSSNRITPKWSRFRLRTLLLVVTLIAIVFGVYRGLVFKYLQQEEIRKDIIAAGGRCETMAAPAWIGAIFGEENVCVVVKVDLTCLDRLQAYSLSETDDYGVNAKPVGPRLLQSIAKLTELRALSVDGQDVSDGIVASWSTLENLESLSLCNTLVSDPAQWPDLPLATLDLSGAVLDDEAIRLLPKYGSLRKLGLNRTRVTDDGIIGLKSLKHLQELQLGFTSITDKSCEVLNALPELDVLVQFKRQRARGIDPTPILIVNGNTLGDGVSVSSNDGMVRKARRDLQEKIADGEGFLRIGALEALHLDLIHGSTQIEELDLTSTFIQVNADCLAALPNLRVLILDDAALSAGQLAKLGPFPRLEEVSLQNIPISDSALEFLSGCPNLEILNLDGTLVTDTALESIAKLESLREISLLGTQVTDAGFEHLANLRNLETIRVTRSSVRGRGLRYLHDLPKLTVVDLSDKIKWDWNKKLRLPTQRLTSDEVWCFFALATRVVQRLKPKMEVELVEWWKARIRTPFPGDSAAYLAYLLRNCELSASATSLLPRSHQRAVREMLDSPWVDQY